MSQNQVKISGFVKTVDTSLHIKWTLQSEGQKNSKQSAHFSSQKDKEIMGVEYFRLWLSLLCATPF